jgi:dsDNA-specific endonuclease/ATPase MutS2
MNLLADNQVYEILNIEVLLDKINPLSPYGTKGKKEMCSYRPGDEVLLEREYDLMDYLEGYYLNKKLFSVLTHVKEISESIYRAEKGEVLTTVELFEVKNFSMLIEKIGSTIDRDCPFDEIRVESLEDIVKLLDPGQEGLNTFYIYDSYSEKLESIRKEKNILNKKIKEIKIEIKNRLKKDYDVRINLKGDISLNKTESDLIKKMDKDSRIYPSSESGTGIVYSIKNSAKIDKMILEMNNLKVEEEEEEYSIMAKLSEKIGECSKRFYIDFKAIGKIDLVLAKLREAKVTYSIRPQIIEEHKIIINEGRHLKTEEALTKKGKSYVPVSVNLNRPATCITGANMGGKTVSLKMIGLVAAAAALGLHVPCKDCTIGLSENIFISIGDEQSVEKGLSTFGAEICNIKRALERADERCLILIDELAGGTNPVEGYAITKSIIGYLADKNSLSVITTHFDGAAGDEVQKLQVAGLRHTDMEYIRENLIENPEKGMDIIGENMDYRLIQADSISKVPRDAINIAELMGLQEQVINSAKEILKGSDIVEK